MLVTTQRRSKMLAAFFAAVLLLGLSLVVTGSAAAKSRGGKTKVYKGGSKNNRGAKLLIKAKTTRRGIPRKVVLVKVTGGSMECWLDGGGKPTEIAGFDWALGRLAVPLRIETNDLYKKIRAFEVSSSSNETPHNVGEGFSVSGRFALNGRRANVNVSRAFVVEGSAVGSSAESVYCNYHALFHVKQLGARRKR